MANIRVIPKTKQVVKQFIPASILRNYLVWTTARDLRAKEEQALKGATPKNRIPEHILSQYRQDVEELIAYVSGKEISIILGSYPTLLVPENIDNFQEIHAASRTYMVEYSLAGMADISSRIDSLTEIIASEHGLGFVDNRQSPPHDADHYADGVHCTDTGSALLAKNIVNYIDSMPNQP